jgi:hypothetical protein
MVDSLAGSSHTCTALLSKMDTLGRTHRPSDNCEKHEDVRKPLIAHTRIDRAEVECRRGVEAVELYDHNDN